MVVALAKMFRFVEKTLESFEKGVEQFLRLIDVCGFRLAVQHGEILQYACQASE